MLILGAYVSLTAAIGAPQLFVPRILASVFLVVLLVVATYTARMLRYQWPTVVLVILTLVGLNLTGVMTSLMAGGAQAGGFLDRACRPDGESNLCQQAFQSRWGGIPLGTRPQSPRISLLVVGMVFYTALLMWFLVIGRPAPTDRWHHAFPLCVTAVAMPAAAFLIYVMYARLAGPCPLCMGSHIVTVLLFLVTALAWPRGGKVTDAAVATGELPNAQTATVASSPVALYAASWHRVVTALVLAAVVSSLGAFASTNIDLQRRSERLDKALTEIINNPDYVRWDFDRQPVAAIKPQPDDSVRGPESAPFIAIAYGDFQCPNCRQLAQRLDEVQAKYPGKLRVVFRHFPLDHSCNAMTTTYMHAFSCQAARAVEAARLVGGNQAFWKMHDAIFARQADLDMRPYAQIAEQIGLDRQRFMDEMNSDRSLQRIRAQIEGSEPLQVSQTPVMYLNGRRVRLWDSMTFWQAVLEGTSASRPASTPTASRP